MEEKERMKNIDKLKMYSEKKGIKIMKKKVE
jgi:hypothetical protein